MEEEEEKREKKKLETSNSTAEETTRAHKQTRHPVQRSWRYRKGERGNSLSRMVKHNVGVPCSGRYVAATVRASSQVSIDFYHTDKTNKKGARRAGLLPHSTSPKAQAPRLKPQNTAHKKSLFQQSPPFTLAFELNPRRLDWPRGVRHHLESPTLSCTTG